ncbi:SDR family NAD(P)-dependent oxidoreductase [Azohydromonas australica]|uniref:SDR family NAD(P)-dependent oxidoreductase n=1 Tax=Azohydromonas australica TaxID=364039 RepID=UPI000404E878|nr:SDR family NAD(P)-dependent oxidoreductase [Azohydromonas australica]
MKRFEGKSALVTGAGRGIGRAIAQALAAEGARVLVSARTRAHGEAVVAAIQERGGEAVLAVGDIGVREDMRATVAAAVEAFGGLDIAVHCAADAAMGRVADMDESAFDRQVHANIHSLFWLARDALPALSRASDKGRLIYISSGAANRSFTPGLIPYMASKAYMNAFARGLANEVGHQGVLVNVVEPGLIASDRMREHLSDDFSARIARPFPVPRPGLPSEIAAAVLFLASSDAAYITGTSLLVDGGATMAPIAGIEDQL